MSEYKIAVTSINCLIPVARYPFIVDYRMITLNSSIEQMLESVVDDCSLDYNQRQHLVRALYRNVFCYDAFDDSAASARHIHPISGTEFSKTVAVAVIKEEQNMHCIAYCPSPIFNGRNFKIGFTPSGKTKAAANLSNNDVYYLQQFLYEII